MYLESVAMLPQLYMFQKQAVDGGSVVEVNQSPQIFSVYRLYSSMLTDSLHHHMLAYPRLFPSVVSLLRRP